MTEKRITALALEPIRCAARAKRCRRSSSSRTGTGFVRGFLCMLACIPLVYADGQQKLFHFHAPRYTLLLMPEAKPIPVRLGDEVIARLDAAANRIGSNRAALIRLCLSTFLDYFERRGGIAALPPDWSELFREQDGRTLSGKTISNVAYGNHGNVTQTFTQAASSSHAAANKGRRAAKGKPQAKRKNK